MELENVRELLPETVQQIVETIGLPATEKLVKAIGGARFKFGKGREDTPRLHILFDAIGEADTYRLLAVFGGEDLYVPRCDKALRELRNLRFAREFARLTQDEGMSGMMAMTQLCPRYGISERTGYTIVYSSAAPAQHGLF